jgi:CubicO group peptidase (beta-lactamase class C family)
VDALAGIARWPVPAAAAAVVRRDGTIAGTCGDLAKPYRLASVTKLLTAYAVLVAVEEGAVELAEPAGPTGSTVAHLLAHASGLAPDSVRVVARPGTRRIYSNAGFEALADHLAAVTGIEFADYLAEAVLVPLEMAATRLAGSAAAGAVAPVEAMVPFVRELLAPRLLPESSLRRATSVAFPGLTGVLPGFGRQDPNDWGLGFEIRDGKRPHWTGTRNSPTTFGHFGSSGTFLWVDPEAGAGCVCLTEEQFGPWAAKAWPELADAVLAELAAPGG